MKGMVGNVGLRSIILCLIGNERSGAARFQQKPYLLLLKRRSSCLTYRSTSLHYLGLTLTVKEMMRYAGKKRTAAFEFYPMKSEKRFYWIQLFSFLLPLLSLSFSFFLWEHSNLFTPKEMSEKIEVEEHKHHEVTIEHGSGSSHEKIESYEAASDFNSFTSEERQSLQHGTKRGLSARHIQMISLGGSIG